jgi:hypothetical protein
MERQRFVHLAAQVPRRGRIRRAHQRAQFDGVVLCIGDLQVDRFLDR